MRQPDNRDLKIRFGFLLYYFILISGNPAAPIANQYVRKIAYAIGMTLCFLVFQRHSTTAACFQIAIGNRIPLYTLGGR